MADIYVRSSDGSDADSGATWALAKATATGAAAIDAAGDRVFLSSAHSESTAGAVTLNFAGTTLAPVQVLSVNDSAEPPTAIAAGATVATSGTNSIAISGCVHVVGVTFAAGSATGNVSVSLATTTVAASQLYENCTLRLGASGTSGAFNIGPANDSRGHRLTLKSCVFDFGRTTSQTINVFGSDVRISGGSIGTTAGAFAGTLFSPFAASGESARILVEGMDFSACAAGVNLCAAPSTASAASHIVFRNCRLPASWSGSLVSGSWPAGAIGMSATMHNCGNGDPSTAGQILWVQQHAGSIKSETTIVRTGGASDGVVPYSWLMATGANASIVEPLVSPELPARWNSTVGSAITVTVEVVTDGVTLKDDECWLDVQYLGSSGLPLSLFASDAKATALTTAANQTTSTETWTTTGLASPTKQKLAVTFTPQEAGYLQPVVRLAKPSTTVYVCPKMVVT